MADRNDDIEKYRRGAITASEMNALEKKALNDPFLADAMEGAEQLSPDDFSEDITQLNEKILGQKRKTIWTPLRIAAGILLLTSISVVMYRMSRTPDSQHLAEQGAPKSLPPAAAPVPDSTKSKSNELLTWSEPVPAVAKKSDSVISSHLLKSNANVPTHAHKGTTRVNDLAVINLNEQADAPKPEPKMITEEIIAKAPVIAEAEEKSDLKVQVPAPTQELAGLDAKKEKKELNFSSGATTAISSLKQVVSGKVTSAETGSPVPGVNVIVKGTSTGTITDEQGNYTLELSDPGDAQLVFSFIGSLTDEVPVNHRTTINTQLKEDVSQLSEVVVIGYGTEKKSPADDGFPTVVMADPAGGKRNFKKYMEANLQYPQQALENKVEGKVTIEFTVRTDGTLDEFKVIKGIGHGCDEEVIRLVKQGPKWYPSRQGETAVESEMRVRMRFKLP